MSNFTDVEESFINEDSRPYAGRKGPSSWGTSWHETVQGVRHSDGPDGNMVGAARGSSTGSGIGNLVSTLEYVMSNHLL